jgi:AcrR family transcriptional regulator
MPANPLVDAASSDRRTRRRQQTIDEILDIAAALMAEDGVNSLSLSEVARRLGVRPPSLYSYFDSLMAIVEALFERGQREHLEVLRTAMADAEHGLPALKAGLDASGRWCLANQPVAELLFWRPIPQFEPSAAAMAPSVEMVALQRSALADAVATGQLGPGGDSDEAVYILSIFITGVLSQAIANEPSLPWGTGRFTPLLRKLIDDLALIYPPPRRSGGGGSRITPGRRPPSRSSMPMRPNPSHCRSMTSVTDLPSCQSAKATLRGVPKQRHGCSHRPDPPSAPLGAAGRRYRGARAPALGVHTRELGVLRHDQRVPRAERSRPRRVPR